MPTTSRWNTARLLLARTGVVYRLGYREECFPLTRREVLLALRRMELRGEARGGRFVAGVDGEPSAASEAEESLRRGRRAASSVRG